MIYDKDFYTRNKAWQKELADVIVPHLKKYEPKSIIDFGCGSGYLLKVLAEAVNTDDYLGINLNDTFGLGELEKGHIVFGDLSIPQQISGHYDLVISLEVAEHLPKESADSFITTLIYHANDRIMFSAATVGQGGEGHINEQPHSYWHDKFKMRGWHCLDIIRPILKGTKVPFWYRNNIFIYERGLK